jgi:hypothetical protein
MPRHIVAIALAATSLIAGTTGCVQDDALGEVEQASCSNTATAKLTGPAVNGQTPSGDAKATTSGADCTVFVTTLTVSVKSLNLPNGTVVTVTDAFTPVGTITLSGGAGSMSTNLGHFFPAGDTIRVVDGGTTYLSGKMAIH